MLRKTAQIALCAFCAGALLFSAGQLAAQDLEEGTVINASNLDQMLDRTFDGHTIRDLLTDRHVWLIENWNLEIELGHVEQFHIDPSLLELTEKHAGEARLNPETRQLENWSGAGMPFPPDRIDWQEDPYAAADKLLWNFWVSQMDGNWTEFPFTYLLIDGNKGLERTQDWWWLRYKFMGRFGEGVEPNINEPGEDILHRTLIVARAPRDIRGLGTYFEFFLREHEAERAFAYLPAVRRIRRLSGGAWMDPIGATDQLNDDINIWNTYPNRYNQNRVVDRRWILHPTPTEGWAAYPGESNLADRYPAVDLENPPNWNPRAKWAPREVFVIEAPAPDEHPYGRKMVYYNVNAPWIHMGEAYDKAGEFWKWIVWLDKSVVGEDGTKHVVPFQGMVLDYQRMHGTIFVSTPEWRFNPQGIRPIDATVRRLEQLAR
ncbi:MAG: DUF1329 domain-containing protein [Xanthomonadales bacterium]|nr:DUF1329 domain-containing protein [Xanthomonadales bacterium]